MTAIGWRPRNRRAKPPPIVAMASAARVLDRQRPGRSRRVPPTMAEAATPIARRRARRRAKRSRIAVTASAIAATTNAARTRNVARARARRRPGWSRREAATATARRRARRHAKRSRIAATANAIAVTTNAVRTRGRQPRARRKSGVRSPRLRRSARHLPLSRLPPSRPGAIRRQRQPRRRRRLNRRRQLKKSSARVRGPTARRPSRRRAATRPNDARAIDRCVPTPDGLVNVQEGDTGRGSSRSLIWLAVAIQLLAFLWEALWHGLLNPAFEHKVTVAEMRRHLLTVHIPFYVGILALLLATGWALLERARRRETGPWIPIAFGAALGQFVGQVWDAWAHLRLSHGGPIAWTLMMLGLVGVPIALWLDSRRRPNPQRDRQGRKGPQLVGRPPA